ncbi:MAG: 16S rRNA (cytosine(1402)-N(4))-methyltransferase RsmH [Candidatus Eremiobacteraeota bacterium]|nr:16S rRNA (cytosine(1402)-N(4))-methyltransferase RsmH [Candidatus Eremiobacteraeota bacterium]
MNHVPVLLQPALELLAIRPDGIYVDATFGAGGHTQAILARLETGRLIAIDADPQARERARALAHPLLTFVNGNFSQLPAILDGCSIGRVDGVLFDLGVSSMQLDDATRGFSFSKSAALDMRMNPNAGVSAYDVLNTASESELAGIFFNYGQERAARRIAHAIVQRRNSGRLPTTTMEFAQMISGIVHRPGKRERIHPATRAFQALRIAVNDELEMLREGLSAATGRLLGAGRIVAISFHSLEDRIVKQTFRDDERLNVLTKKPVAANDDEVATNSRARSAKLRAAERKVS